MRKLRNPFADLTVFERVLWGVSVAVIVLSAVMMGGADLLSVTASLIGVTALIFVAKGYVIGQILTVVVACVVVVVGTGAEPPPVVPIISLIVRLDALPPVARM